MTSSATGTEMVDKRRVSRITSYLANISEATAAPHSGQCRKCRFTFSFRTSSFVYRCEPHWCYETKKKCY